MRGCSWPVRRAAVRPAERRQCRRARCRRHGERGENRGKAEERAIAEGLGGEGVFGGEEEVRWWVKVQCLALIHIYGT
eukprot:35329-Eustigmatos_ZCMA.PRE.1